MYNLIFVLSLAPDNSAAHAGFIETIGKASAELPGLRGFMFAPTLPNVYHGGDYLLRLAFATREEADAAMAGKVWAPAKALIADRSIVTHLQRVAYPAGRGGGRADSPKDAGLYRVALFCANVRPTPERLAAFADQTLAMPRHIRSILNWQLAAVDEAEGDRPWTTVWEQEYHDLDGLNGPYMMHPIHWAHVERWFDTEYTEHLVDPFLVHSFCRIEQPVIIF